MSSTNLDNVVIDDEESMMNPHASLDENDLFKSFSLTEEDLKSIEKDRLKHLFGSNARHFDWQALNDKTKVEQVEKFTNGGFADVFWFKFKTNGQSIHSGKYW